MSTATTEADEGQSIPIADASNNAEVEKLTESASEKVNGETEPSETATVAVVEVVIATTHEDPVSTEEIAIKPEEAVADTSSKETETKTTPVDATETAAKATEVVENQAKTETAGTEEATGTENK
ncbi:1778_t:CDS:2, partial [Gigaspora rosea]